MQYGKELDASWSWHTPLTGIPNPSPMDNLWDIRDRLVHDFYPFPAATLLESERQLVEQWQRIPQGVGEGYMYKCIHRLLLSMEKGS